MAVDQGDCKRQKRFLNFRTVTVLRGVSLDFKSP